MFNRNAQDRDLDEELRAYVDLLVAEKIRAGMTADAAQRAALIETGGIAQVKEGVRDVRPGVSLDTLLQDVRYAARSLRRHPALTATAVLTLAIGIGANAAIFTVVDAVLLRPLPPPVRAPNELVAVGRTTSVEGHTTGAPRADLYSLPLYRDLRAQTRSLSGLAATGTAGRLDVRIGGTGDYEHPAGRFVSGNYFDVLGVTAARGRLFASMDDDRAAGAAPDAVISDFYWRLRFGAAPNVVGRELHVGDATLRIVGVTPPGFTGEVVERPTDVWLPIGMEPIIAPHAAPIEERGTAWLLFLGRLAPSVTLASATPELTALIRRSLVANAMFAGERDMSRRAVVPITSGAKGLSAVRRAYGPALEELEAGVALLLLIVCTNVGNLLLARAVTRGPEMSLRLALGASRRRLVRQLMTESAMLAAVGGVAGLAFAWWGSRALAAAAAVGRAPIAPTRVDASVVGFTLAVTIVAVVAFGLAPALRTSRVDIASSLRAKGRVSHRPRARGGRVPIGRVLIPLQVTVSLVLLVGATLLARSLLNLDSGDAGLDRDHLLVVDVDAGTRGYAGARFAALTRDIVARLAALPGVRAVSYSQNGLFSGHEATALVAIPGFTGHGPDDSIVHYDFVGTGYMRAIGGTLLRGRDVEASDAAGRPSVAVVNEALEHFYFGRGSAIGKTIFFDTGVPTTIVGVVADVRDHSLTESAPRRAYVPYAQQIADTDRPSLVVEVRAAGDPAALVAPVREAITAVDDDLPLAAIAPLSVTMRASVREQRLVAVLAIGFGVVALALAAIGLYGVMTYAVARRTGEIGLRAALGAGRSDVIWLVLGDGLRLVVVGIALGAPLALVAARSLRGQLYDVPPTDPLSIAIALVVLVASAVFAALLPALRASRVSPAVALAQE
jgi:predicted permease